MKSIRLNSIEKLFGILLLSFFFAAMFFVPSALADSSEADNFFSNYRIIKGYVTVGGEKVECPFTVTDENHTPIYTAQDVQKRELGKDPVSHYVLVGYPSDSSMSGGTAIDKDVTGELVIPSQITDDEGNVYDVTATGEYAFAHCHITTTGLKDNKSITMVNVGTYLECPNIDRTDLETSSVIKVDSTAFAISGISDTGLANNTTLKPAAFAPQEGHHSDGALGKYCFEGCYNLKTTGLENNTLLDEVPDLAFAFCKGLESTGLEHNSTVKKIDFEAFCNDTSLASTELGSNSSVTDFGECAFGGCTNLTDTGLSTNTTLTEVSKSLFTKCSALKNTGLESNHTVKSIADYAFQESGITYTGLDRNDSVETIGTSAFKKTNIVSTGLGTNHTVKSIGSGAFMYDGELTDTGLAGNSTVETLEGPVFGFCKQLKDTGLGTNSGIHEIPNGAFEGCFKLEETGLTNNQHISKIGKDAFASCMLLGSKATDSTGAGDLILNGDNGKLEVDQAAFLGTKYNKLYIKANPKDLTTNDKVFGDLTKTSSMVIYANPPSQIKTVYVPDTPEWRAKYSMKIAGRTYSRSEGTLVLKKS